MCRSSSIARWACCSTGRWPPRSRWCFFSPPARFFWRFPPSPATGGSSAMREATSALLYRAFVYGVGGLAMLYLIAPIIIALVMSFTAGQTLQFPPQGLSLRWYAALLDPDASATEHIAAFNSLKIAGLAVVGSLLFAVPASIGMARVRGRAANLMEPLLLA